ncbi:hypothetical protein CUMW_274750 [Citrus unshiu]|uniref:Hydrophobic seed protein domain-containing protein n=1 Tax=Citrus unshiu TaxID=55188 RepID=A0A2H5N083_CITUN|nr:hypothetical protein CUMW_274750 [Citrus unshiu]
MATLPFSSLAVTLHSLLRHLIIRLCFVFEKWLQNLLSLNILFFVLSHRQKPEGQCLLCADVLGAIVLKLPAPQHECRSPIGNLVGLNAVACLSTSLHVNVLNLIKLDVPIDLSLLLNHCDVSSTNEFKCA